MKGTREFIHDYFDCKMTEDSDIDICERLIDDINCGEIEKMKELMEKYAKYYHKKMLKNKNRPIVEPKLTGDPHINQLIQMGR